MKNTTYINNNHQLVVEFNDSIRPVTYEDRAAIAALVAQRMYGEDPGRTDVPDVPAQELWSIDKCQDWLLQFHADNSGITIRHRNPRDRYTLVRLILSELEVSLATMDMKPS